MTGLPTDRIMRAGPVDGQISVTSAAGGTVYLVDLSQFAQDPSTVELGLFVNTGIVYYKFTSDPIAGVNASGTSGAARCSVFLATAGVLYVKPPVGAQYLAFAVSTACLVRIANVTNSGNAVPNNTQMMNIYAEGDSATALDVGARQYTGIGGAWWEQAQFMLRREGIAAKWKTNNAVSGSTWAVTSSLITRGSALDALAKASLYNVLIVSASTNDALAGDSAVTIQTNFNTWCDARIASGKWDAIIGMAVSAQTGNSAVNTVLDTYHTYLQSQVGGRLTAYIGRPSILDDSFNLEYYVPNANHVTGAEHKNANGQRIMADEVTRVLRSIAVPAP